MIALSGRCVVAQVYKIVNLLDWLGQIELPRYWRHSIWPFKDALQHSYYSLLIQTKKSKLIEQKAKEMAKDAEKKAYEAEQLKRQVCMLHILLCTLSGMFLESTHIFLHCFFGVIPVSQYGPEKGNMKQ